MAKARGKTKAKATAKASATAAAMTTAVARSVATWSAGNLRGRERRAATRAMNELAVEVGVRKVRLKAKAAYVEALARSLEARCRTGDLPARLRAAVEAYPVLILTFALVRKLLRRNFVSRREWDASRNAMLRLCGYGRWISQAPQW